MAYDYTQDIKAWRRALCRVYRRATAAQVDAGRAWYANAAAALAEYTGEVWTGTQAAAIAACDVEGKYKGRSQNAQGGPQRTHTGPPAAADRAQDERTSDATERQTSGPHPQRCTGGVRRGGGTHRRHGGADPCAAQVGNHIQFISG